MRSYKIARRARQDLRNQRIATRTCIINFSSFFLSAVVRLPFDLAFVCRAWSSGLSVRSVMHILVDGSSQAVVLLSV